MGNNVVALYDDGAGFDDDGGSLPAVLDNDDGPSLSDTIRGAIDLQRERRGEPARYQRESREVAHRAPGQISRAQFERLPAPVRSALSEHAELAPYAALARQNGTSIGAAVQKYNMLENLMVANPVAGIESICNVLRIPLPQLANSLVDRCNRPHLYPSVEAAVGQVQANQQIARTAADTKNYPHFQALRQDMIALLQGGQAFNLHDAYHHAARARGLHGGRSSDASRRARGASKHVGGSPARGQGGEYRSDPNNMSLRDTIVDAINQQEGY